MPAVTEGLATTSNRFGDGARERARASESEGGRRQGSRAVVAGLRPTESVLGARGLGRPGCARWGEGGLWRW